MVHCTTSARKLTQAVFREKAGPALASTDSADLAVADCPAYRDLSGNLSQILIHGETMIAENMCACIFVSRSSENK